ncbi:MAG: methyltransferase [Candidatus Binatia bacterium]
MGTIVAVALLVLGAALEVWAGLALGLRRWLDLGTAAPDPALPMLVLGGPFGLTRHPQTLGLILLLSGGALWVGRLGVWLVALLLVALLIVRAWQDDQRLALRFGAAYERYRRAVSFLVPGIP